MLIGLLKNKRNNYFKNNISIEIMLHALILCFILMTRQRTLEIWLTNSVVMIYLMKKISHPLHFQNSFQMFWMTVEPALHSKQNLCGTCCCTYTEDECLKCKQDIEFQSTLQQDQNLVSFVDSLLAQPPNSPLPPLLIEESVTQD